MNEAPTGMMLWAMNALLVKCVPTAKQLREHEAEDAYYRRLQESIEEEEERLGPFCETEIQGC